MAGRLLSARAKGVEHAELFIEAVRQRLAPERFRAFMLNLRDREGRSLEDIYDYGVRLLEGHPDLHVSFEDWMPKKSAKAMARDETATSFLSLLDRDVRLSKSRSRHTTTRVVGASFATGLQPEMRIDEAIAMGCKYDASMKRIEAAPDWACRQERGGGFSKCWLSALYSGAEQVARRRQEGGVQEMIRQSMEHFKGRDDIDQLARRGQLELLLPDSAHRGYSDAIPEFPRLPHGLEYRSPRAKMESTTTDTAVTRAIPQDAEERKEGDEAVAAMVEREEDLAERRRLSNQKANLWGLQELEMPLPGKEYLNYIQQDFTGGQFFFHGYVCVDSSRSLMIDVCSM